MLHVSAQREDKADLLGRLQRLLGPGRPGSSPVHVEYRNDRACAALRLGAEWQVSISDKLVDRLRAEFGKENVRIRYESFPKKQEQADGQMA